MLGDLMDVIRGAKSVVLGQKLLTATQLMRKKRWVGKKFGSRNIARPWYNDLYVETVRKNEVGCQLFFKLWSFDKKVNDRGRIDFCTQGSYLLQPSMAGYYNG